MTRGGWLRELIHWVVTPCNGVDLLAMRRIESRHRCYDVNDLMRATVDTVINRYDLVVTDIEAGI